jgi:TRAP transporter TAXI family solute receptor
MRMRIALLFALTAMLSSVPTVAGAAGTEVDPASVSEGLKAIFKYGTGTRQTTERLNANTTTIMTGTIAGTYVQFGADLASALDDGDNLRVLPIIGRGSVQGVADILFLKGVDLGIVRSDTLEYLEKKGYANNIKKQFAYITKLYNEEMHVLAPKSINSLAELEGKTVAVDLPNGGTFVTSAIVFERLGIHANFAYIEQRLAFEKLKQGEIDAMIWVQGKPSKFSTTIKDENFHLIPVNYAQSLQPDYLPAQLTSEDYPNLIAPGERIDTMAAPAVLAAYNWAPNTDRYHRLARFVDALFGKIGTLQQPPFHPKWKEVALNAPLPGWSRFRAAQEWLDRKSVVGMASSKSVGMASSDVRREVRRMFEQFLNENQARSPGFAKSEDRDALFRQFLEWQKRQ